jgi:hypothetical protein
LLATIEAGLERYRNQFQSYPPSRPSELGGRRGIGGLNSLNNGAEALAACLSTRKSGGPFVQFSDAEARYGNLDADASARVKQEVDWWFGDDQLREILDYWGGVIAYRNARDYAKTGDEYTRYTTGGSEAGQRWQLEVLKATKTFPNPQTFVLVAPGPDGKLGTADDVTNWE